MTTSSNILSPDGPISPGEKITASDQLKTQTSSSKNKKKTSQIRKLSMLIDVTRRLTSCRTTDEVINQILHSALEAIETADAGIFYLYDEVNGLLKVQTAIGFTTEAVYYLEMQPGESMSGKAFATGQAALYSNSEEIWANMSSQSPSNLEYMSEATGGKTFPKSAIVSPLNLKKRPIGAIVLDNFEVSDAFDPSDLHLLQALVDQAAIIIDNLLLYEHQAQLYAQQSQLVQRLEQALRIHNQLTRTVLFGHGVDGIVSALSTLLENQVILFDKNGEIQAASPSLQPPETLQEPFQAWLASSKNIRAVENVELTIFNSPVGPVIANNYSIKVKVSPINVGGDLLGWIVVMPGAKPLGELDSVALEHAATVFGLEFMKQQALFEIEMRWKGDLIDDLLSGKPSPDFDRRAKALGLDINEPFICLRIDIDDFADYIQSQQISEDGVQRLKEWFHQTLSNVVRTVANRSLVSQKSDELIVFATCSSAEPQIARQLAKQIAETFQTRIKRKYPSLSVSIAISGIGQGRAAMEVALVETKRLLEHYQQIKYYDGIHFASELGVNRFLLQLPDNSELLSWATSLLGVLLDYDKTNQTDLLPTLATFCANNRNIAETALALHAHQNTIRYRLERIKDLLGDITSQSEGWFNIEMALRVLRLYGKAR